MRQISLVWGGLLVITITACGGTGTTAATPTVGPSPAASAQAAGRGGRGGAGGARPSAVDTTRYVRTTPPSDPVIQAMYEEGMHHSQTVPLSQVLFDSI